MRICPVTQERFDTDPCVLSCEGYTSGRHAWEVEVWDKGCWAVGVARESVRRKGHLIQNPEEGIWAVQRWVGQYQALTSPVTHLSLCKVPQMIWVSLDYEQGQVTFFSAGNEAPIFTFPLTSFAGEKIRLWLWVGGRIPAQAVSLRYMGNTSLGTLRSVSLASDTRLYDPGGLLSSSRLSTV